MKNLRSACLLSLALTTPSAFAAEEMIRIFRCQGTDAEMEIYSALGAQDFKAGKNVRGFYSLDLSRANKGKTLEPVSLRLSADGKAIEMARITRRLPPVSVPLAGGVLDFDQRFGTRADCRAE